MRLFSFLMLCLLATAPQSLAGESLGFAVPDGFEVSLYADDDLATDIFSLTIDARGRVLVAGKGYVKTLHDTDGDGKADSATLFAEVPASGAHGMYFDGDDLICNGDSGVRRLADTDGDGRCDRVSPVWLPTNNDGDHAANGIVKGPDGWFYMIAGNDAGIGRAHAAAPTSPVREPNAGAVVRFSADGKGSEVLAHGFRNPYDLDFDRHGRLLTVDADGERIHYMPYYAPNRLFDIAQGRHHGWILPGWQRGWSRPPWWPDSVERLVEIGRGSPTGVVVYRHDAFPEKYRNGVFSLCWSFGRVYFFPLEKEGGTYRAGQEIFMRTVGDVGFAPTDMAVGPDGDLFISIGGRGTRGGVFRVHYTGKKPAREEVAEPVRKVLTAPQPLSSWSRAQWVPRAKQLGPESFADAVDDPKLPLPERIRAVEVLTELFGGVPVAVARQVCGKDSEPELVARVLWSLSRSKTGDAGRGLVVSQAESPEPWVARAAWEALMVWPGPVDVPSAAWRTGLTSTDRGVRSAAIAVAMGRGRESVLAAWTQAPPRSAREKLAELWVRGVPTDAEGVKTNVRRCLAVLHAGRDAGVKLEAVRLAQIALGDVDTDEGPGKSFVGYRARNVDKIDPQWRQYVALAVAEEFPSGDADLDLEAARLLGMLGERVAGLAERVAAKWTDASRVEGDIHYLLVLSQLPGERSGEVTKATAQALNAIHAKLAKRGAKFTDQVPDILEALFDRLQGRDPGLAAAVVSDPGFGLPAHAIYAARMPQAEKRSAARKLVAAVGKLGEEEARAAWGPDLVQLVAALPAAESLPILRDRFDDPQLTDTIALVLARERRPEDFARFVAALGSTQPGVVQAAADALLKLTRGKPAPAAVGRAVQALRRLEVQKADAGARKSLGRLLAAWTGNPAGLAAAELSSAPAWVAWYTKTYPKQAAELPGLSETSFAAWKKRLAAIDWESGDADRGRLVFERQNCFRCHGAQRRLGPDLTGVAQRFSRDDLFQTIIEPSKDVSPAYRPTTVVTNSGKVYTGMVIYQSPALTLLQTTPDTTVRVPREELQLVQPGSVSFMPEGLLDAARDGELADLYAYLKTLRKQ